MKGTLGAHGIKLLVGTLVKGLKLIIREGTPGKKFLRKRRYFVGSRGEVLEQSRSQSQGRNVLSEKGKFCLKKEARFIQKQELHQIQKEWIKPRMVLSFSQETRSLKTQGFIKLRRKSKAEVQNKTFSTLQR